MKVAQLIATHLQEAFAGNNWSEVNVKDTLDGITYPEAVMVTSASSNTIAALLYHMTFYNRAITQRLQGIEPEISAANGFDLQPISSEHDWEQLKKNAFDTVNELARAIRHFPDERLEEENPKGKGSFYKKLQGVIEHNYYHLGQIVILKNLIKKQQE
jgi:uncharacterized damage-inducible protein DinB